MAIRWGVIKFRLRDEEDNHGRFWRTYQHVDDALGSGGAERTIQLRPIWASFEVALLNTGIVDAAHTRALLKNIICGLSVR